MSVTNGFGTNAVTIAYDHLSDLVTYNHLENKSNSVLLTNLTTQVQNLTTQIQNLESKLSWPSCSRERIYLVLILVISFLFFMLLGSRKLHNKIENIIKKCRNKWDWVDTTCRKIEDDINDPKNPFLLIRVSFVRHFPEYLFFFFLPVIAGIYLSSNLMTIIGVWGFLVTTLGAYYAQRAEAGSKKAHEQALKTHDFVLHFADNLSGFVEKARSRMEKELLDERGEILTLKMVSVIPVFGSVGLREHYIDQLDKNTDYKTLHNFIYHHVSQTQKIRRFELITHDGNKALDWIADIMEVSARPDLEKFKSNPSKQTEIKKHAIKSVGMHYFQQKKFLRALSGGIAKDHYAVWKWDPESLFPSENTTERNRYKDSSIPFQFILAESATKTMVFVLFSGSYLYDLILKTVAVRNGVGMKQLVEFSRGYYEDTPSVTGMFKMMFKGFVERMPRLDPPENTYNSHMTVKMFGEQVAIDISGEYSDFDELLTQTQPDGRKIILQVDGTIYTEH